MGAPDDAHPFFARASDGVMMEVEVARGEELRLSARHACSFRLETEVKAKCGTHKNPGYPSCYRRVHIYWVES